MSRNINSAGTEQHQPNELMITCKTAGSNAPSLCNSPLCKIKQTRECGFLGSISPLRKLSFCKRKKKNILSFLALTFFFFSLQKQMYIPFVLSFLLPYSRISCYRKNGPIGLYEGSIDTDQQLLCISSFLCKTFFQLLTMSKK